MSVRYTWVANTLKPGTYYARVIPRGAVRLGDVVEQVAARTFVDRADVQAVMGALRHEVVEGLAAGRSVILDDFVGFSVGLELKDAPSATTPELLLTPEDVVIRVNVTAKSGVLRRVQQRLVIERLGGSRRLPQVREVFDHMSRGSGCYSAGGVLEVRGWDLALPADFEPDPRQGVFFRDSLGGEIRAEVYIRPTAKVITCLVPDGVDGTVTIEVRTTYGDKRLACGSIAGVPQAGKTLARDRSTPS